MEITFSLKFCLVCRINIIIITSALILLPSLSNLTEILILLIGVINAEHTNRLCGVLQ